jgi:hypothetical protein
MQSVNDTLKTLTEAGFEIAGALVDMPVAGAIGSALVSLFWPDSTTDVWMQVQNSVATLLNQTFDQTTYTNLSNLLSGPPGSENEGLLGAYNEYLASLDSGDPTLIQGSWTAARASITSLITQFQKLGLQDAGAFLALFTQVGNLQLALLKDGVNKGADWGLNGQGVAQIHQELKQAIYSNAKWVESTYTAGLPSSTVPPPGIGGSSIPAGIWQQQNTYIRAMVLTVWDFVFLWPYFDPDSATPPPANTREIYSDLIGALTNNPIDQSMDSGTQPLLPTLPAPAVTINYDPGVSPQPPNPPLPKYSSCAPIALQWNQPLPRPAVAGITTWVQYTPNDEGSPWVYTLFSAQVSRAGTANPDPITGAQPPIGAASSWSTIPITSARGGFGGGMWPYINWIQFVSNNDPANVSSATGNLFGSNYNEIWAGPQPFVFTYPSHQLSNLLFTQVAQPDPPHNYSPMPVAVIFGFRLSNSY